MENILFLYSIKQYLSWLFRGIPGVNKFFRRVINLSQGFLSGFCYNKVRTMRITEEIAKYIVSREISDFSSESINLGKYLIIDTIVCAIAASKEPAVDILCDTFRPLGNGLLSIIGRKERSSVFSAAMINGYLSHALDFDSTSINYKSHISAVLLPPLLAVAEEKNLSGAKVLLSFLTGYEVFCILGSIMGRDYFDAAGWHPTSPLGVVAAAAAVSKLISLEEEKITSSLSIASSLASGLRQNFGTMTKSLHIGMAARNAIISVLLAKRGFTAAKDGIGGEFGFVHAFSWGNSYDRNKLSRTISNLGKVDYILGSKTMIKKYPCCASAHLAIDATIDIVKKQNVSPSLIKKVVVVVDFDPPRSLIYKFPKNGTEGRFSMQYCIAVAIVDKKIDMRSFTDKKVQRPDIQKLMSKITMVREDKYIGKPSWTEGFNEVQIYLNDGKVIKKRMEREHLLEFTKSDIARKFFDCCNFVRFENSSRILEQLDYIDKIKNIRSLMKNLGRPKN